MSMTHYRLKRYNVIDTHYSNKMILLNFTVNKKQFQIIGKVK